MISQILATSSRIRLDPKIDSGNLPGWLKKGQILEARVDQGLSGRHVRLIIDGKSVSARTHLPLQPGEKILLRVTRAGAQPEFQLIDTTGEGGDTISPDGLKIMGKYDPYRLLARLLATRSDSNPIKMDMPGSEAFQRLEHLLKAMRNPSGHADGNMVKSFINKSGLTWENKLLTMLQSDGAFTKETVQRLIAGDLKALSMAVAQSAEDKEGALVTSIRAYLEGIERLQVVNSEVSKESGRYLIPLPTPFDENLRFGQMLIDMGKESSCAAEKKTRLVRVSLLLEMSNLGTLQADLSILGNAITGTLRVENETIETLIDAHMAALVEKFQKNGFHVFELSCCRVDPQTLSSASLAERLVDDRSGLLSIVI